MRTADDRFSTFSFISTLTDKISHTEGERQDRAGCYRHHRIFTFTLHVMLRVRSVRSFLSGSVLAAKTFTRRMGVVRSLLYFVTFSSRTD